MGKPVAFSANWNWPPDPLHSRNQCWPDWSTQKSKCPSVIAKARMNAHTPARTSPGMSTAVMPFEWKASDESSARS
ncbi:MAG: hypothetical protein H0V92_09580 [Pseudonocardiales bacterium]|nr:hypothetical protein [Pseudonocardiales bacterium]